MKKIITTIIGVVLVVGIIFAIFWFFFNVGTRSDVEVKETKKKEVKQVETQVEDNEIQDDNVIVINKEELKQKQEEQRKQEFETEQLFEKTFIEICNKNGNWEDLPLSDNFKKKYNAQNGIVDKKIDYDKALYVDSINRKKCVVNVILYKNLNKTNEIEYKCEINYTVNEENKIDDILTVNVEKTNGEFSIKEEGDNKDWAYINENNISEIIYIVSKPKAYWDELKLTSNFKGKYTQDKGILKLDASKVSNVNVKEQDYKNKIVIVEVLYNDRKIEQYKVKWKVSSNLELDDVEVEKIEQVDDSPLAKSGLSVPKGTEIKSYNKPVLSQKSSEE